MRKAIYVASVLAACLGIIGLESKIVIYFVVNICNTIHFYLAMINPSTSFFAYRLAYRYETWPRCRLAAVCESGLGPSPSIVGSLDCIGTAAFISAIYTSISPGKCDRLPTCSGGNYSRVICIDIAKAIIVIRAYRNRCRPSREYCAGDQNTQE